MFGERRKHQRYLINRAAKFVVELGAPAHDCMIVDLSESGARITSEIKVPDQFTLLIFGDTEIKQVCVVAWRLGVEVGVAFVTRERERARQEAMKKFVSEAREILSKPS